MPTRHLLSLILVLIGVCYAAVSQGNGPAYLPAYALFSLLLISWLHNNANVRQMELTTHRTVNGFAGSVILLPFKLRNLKKRTKLGLTLTTNLGGKATVGRLETLVEGTVSIRDLPRGIHQIDFLQIDSIFPLGVFRSRFQHRVSCECIVYPEPRGEREISQADGKSLPGNSGTRTTGDDFAGVRNYQTGESQRHIDWKAVARGQPLMIKQFESIKQNEIWLDAASLNGMELESKLSQLAKWIVDSERAGFRYGLQCNGKSIAVGSGNTHFQRCLRELAASPTGVAT